MKKYLFLFALPPFIVSCAAGCVIGRNNTQHQETKTDVVVDSSHVVPTLTIK